MTVCTKLPQFHVTAKRSFANALVGSYEYVEQQRKEANEVIRKPRSLEYSCSCKKGLITYRGVSGLVRITAQDDEVLLEVLSCGDGDQRRDNIRHQTSDNLHDDEGENNRGQHLFTHSLCIRRLFRLLLFLLNEISMR